jgi:hypothetical protein
VTDSKEAKREPRDTYFARQQAELDESDGRFLKRIPTTLTGETNSSVPRQPENSPWHDDPVPPEPPLGEEV